MKYRPIYMDISVVTIVSIVRYFCNPFYLYKNRVIGKEDLDSINDKDMIISHDEVSFRADNFDLYCDSNRMQVRSQNISLSTMLSDITLNILRLSEKSPSAIGINACFRFCLDDNSFLRFCNKFLPNEAFIPLAENALMLDMTFQDWNQAPNSDEPNVMYSIRRLKDLTKDQKVVQISVNNHLEIDSDYDVTRYLGEAVKRHNMFFDKCQQFIKAI